LSVRPTVPPPPPPPTMPPGRPPPAHIIGGPRYTLVGAFSVGMGLLLAATVLSYYKPWGRIPWPWCRP
jgi:hypothetical protein